MVLYRASRPQRISVTRMWIQAGFLILLAALAIFAAESQSAPMWQVALAAVLGLIAGIPVGLLRGHHTQVAATTKHGVMQLGPSWVTAGIYLGAFLLRAVIRATLPAGTLGAVAGDGLLVFAIGIVGATYYAVYRKYELLDHLTPA